MISPRKVIKMAAVGRKRISLPRTNTEVLHLYSSNDKSFVAEKDHFVIYATDQRRYVFPLMYLSSSIFLELLKLSEEKFGISSDGPCDAAVLDFVVSFIQRDVEPKNGHKALWVPNRPRLVAVNS